MTDGRRSGYLAKQQAHKLAQIYRDAPVGLCFLDVDLRYLHINDWLAALNGIPADDHLGRRLSEILPDVAAGVEPQLRSVIETGEPLVGGTVDAETLAHPGLIRTFQHNYFPVVSDDSTVVGVSCVVEDITDRMRMESVLLEAKQDLEAANKNLDSKVEQRTDELRYANRRLKTEIAEREQAQKRFEELLEAAPDATISVDLSGKIILVNQQTKRVLGYEQNELIGQSVESLVPGRLRGHHVNHRQNYSKDPMHRAMGSERELAILHKDGRELPVEISLAPVLTSGSEFVIASIRDITDRKLIEQTLRSQGARLIHAQEEERRRIARDLHDDYSQELALMAIDLDRLDKGLPKSEAMIHQTVRDLLARNQKIANGLHKLSHSLHPSNIEFLGFEKVVESFCVKFSDQHNIRVDFTHNTIPGTIREDVALCLYRIIQEAMQNVQRHSGADKARIEITGDQTSVRLSISDSGVGFDPKLVQSKGGIGLVSIQERLRLVGGRFSLESQETQGTRMDIHVPLAQ